MEIQSAETDWMRMETAVKVRGLKFKYQRGKDFALNGIDFNLAKGEAVGLAGKSGAGKSTLLFCMNRIVPNFYSGDFSGEVQIFSENISTKQTYQLASQVGLVLQDFESQLFSTRAELDVAFGLENLGVPRKEMAERIESALRAVGMESFRNRDPESLSGGEKQRLAIASILALSPGIILFDEAFTDLDPLGREQVREVIKKLRAKGISIIIVDYEPESLLLAERLLILENGKIIEDAPSQKIFSDLDLLLKNGIRAPEMAELFHGLKLSPIEFEPERAYRIIQEKGFRLKPEVLEEFKKADAEKEQARGEVIIKVEGLEHTYPNGNQALSGIELEIKRGDFLAIIGQNGSGKTTLVKHLNGLLKPTKGSVYFYGKEVKPEMVSDLGREVGYVFQNPDHQIFSSRVFDEVAFAPRNYGFSEKQVKDRVADALSLVGLSGREDENPFLMTKGERQRLAIASVLSASPQVLVFDEPTTGLDYQEQLKIMDLLKTLNQQGKTIIIITHTLWLPARYATRAIVMAKSKKILEGTTREVLSQPEILKTASLVPPEITRFGLEFGFGFLKVEEAIKALGGSG